MSLEQKLIAEVKRHRYVYDKHDDLYKNIHLKNKAWDKIAEKLNIKVEYAKKRWKTLRDRYIRHKKTFGKKSEWPRNRVPWKYHKAMSFLDDVVVIKSENEESGTDDDDFGLSFNKPNQATKTSNFPSAKRKAKDDEKLMMDAFNDISELITTAKTAFSETTTTKTSTSALRKFLFSLASQTEEADLPLDELCTLQIDLLSIVHNAIRKCECEKE